MVDITGLDKAEVLATLYNHAHAVGLGVLHDLRRNMTKMEAENIIKEHPHKELYFDYVFDRRLKVKLGGDEFDPWLFDQDAGEGTAQRAIDNLRASKRL